jgi:hypothetical protein
MKKYTVYVVIFFVISSQLSLGQVPFPLTQTPNPFPTDYNRDKKYNVEKTEEYKDIEGTPYLKDEFQLGVFYLKNSKTLELPIRYNIYRDEMEYLLDGVSYVVGSPESLVKVIFAGSEFRYLPAISKGGYFELFVSGKSNLLLKRAVEYRPSEGSKPIVGLQPAKFVRSTDIFYLVINQAQVFRVLNMSSVIMAFQDQKTKIEDFIKKEKIKNIKKENLVKIVNYYNGL